MYTSPDVAADRAAAQAWAHELRARPAPNWLIFACATTGLERFAEIVQYVVLTPDGTVLLDYRVRPVAHIPEAATALHNLDDKAVASALSFVEVYPQLTALLHGRPVLAWNAARCQAFITQSHRALGGHSPTVPGYWHCLMLWYAQYLGVWLPAQGHYQHPELPGTDHTALGEARAVLALLDTLAAAEPSIEQEVA